MNIQNLRETYPALIAHMEECEYNRNYIERLEQQINTILSNTETYGCTSYSDIYRYYESITDSKESLRYRLTLLGVIERFDLRGEFPDGRTRQKVKIRGKYQYLSPEFKSVIDAYHEAEARRKVKKDQTIYGETSNAASFLYELQCFGISTTAEISQTAVITVFLNDDGTLRRSCSYKKILAAVFKANVPKNPELFNRLIAYLPELRETRKNIQYLTAEESTAVKFALIEPNSVLSLRDKAIGTMALCYGLRCCDIAGLKLNEVDLDRDKISIRQQKTNVPLELPLTTTVGNAIYKYVTAERPESNCEFVFLSANRPYGRLTEGSVGNIAARIMKSAEIRQNIGDRKGFHIFRHRLAAELLGNGVAQPIISKIAGHTSPDSLEAYLSADFVHLKECAVSIEQFPVRKEVFGNA
jgi:integrase